MPDATFCPLDLVTIVLGIITTLLGITATVDLRQFACRQKIREDASLGAHSVNSELLASTADYVDESQVTLPSDLCSVFGQSAVTVALLEVDSGTTPRMLPGLVRKENELPRSRLMRKPAVPSASPLPHPIFHDAVVRAKGERASDLGDEVRCVCPSRAKVSESLCVGVMF